MGERGNAHVFISHTHADKGIADALSAALRTLFQGRVDVCYSTSKEDGGIPAGISWFQWIVDQVRDCEVAYVLLTPSSIQRPWIPWEAGAVYGAALGRARASGGAGDDDGSGAAQAPVQPLLFHIEDKELPDPFHTLQFARGDKLDDMRKVFKALRRQIRGVLPEQVHDQSLLDLDRTAETFIAEVEKALATAPLTPTEAAVQEWCGRLDGLRAQKRFSEAKQLHDWLELAFGRSRKDTARPLDLRIHRRLGELYLDGKSYARAAEQFELCRRLAPRDLFILRSLGQAYVDADELDKAKGILDVIVGLDEDAFLDADCAALKGRWLSAKGKFSEAREVLTAALDHNETSHYLAGRLAQTELDLPDVPAARKTFARLQEIIEGLDEQNVWTHASAANAAVALGKHDDAVAHLTAIAALGPSAGEVQTIERGLRDLRASLGPGAIEIDELLATLRPPARPEA